jgi:hypothetical protein
MTKQSVDTKISTPDDKEGQNTISKEGEVRIYIDPVITDGGLRTNDKLYVGWVNVSQDIAQDLQRRVEECQEIKNFLQNPTRTKVRIKNFYVMEKQFLADPSENYGKKDFTNEYGLLDPWQWQFIPKEVQEELKERRKAIYGY